MKWQNFYDNNNPSQFGKEVFHNGNGFALQEQILSYYSKPLYKREAKNFDRVISLASVSYPLRKTNLEFCSDLLLRMFEDEVKGKYYPYEESKGNI